MEEHKQSARAKLPTDREQQNDASQASGTGHGLSELISIQWQRERTDLDLQNFLLAIYFMRLGTLVDRAYDRHCQKLYGINGGDMRVMLALRRSGPPYVKRPTDLYRALLVTSGAITKKVDRLVEAGFAERLSDPGHSGGFLVHLTKKGLHIVEEAVEHLANHSALAPAMSQLTPEERKRGSAFALRILSALESVEMPSEDEIAEPPKRAGSGRSPGTTAKARTAQR
jgi:DNA-binding MarR family transcriptional regulator